MKFAVLHVLCFGLSLFAPTARLHAVRCVQWENLSEDFAENDDVHIAHVDCTSQRDVCSKHGVRGYPTLQLFNGGDASTGKKYAGGRDQSSLKSFVESHAK